MNRSWRVAAGVAAVGVVTAVLWLRWSPEETLSKRIPGTDRGPAGSAAGGNVFLAGKVLAGSGKPDTAGGDWPQFRGIARDGQATNAGTLARTWPGAPRELWGVDLGEGYAGPAIWQGRVYLMDYDQTNRADALRCLSLADGQEIWRYTYPVRVKRNHGMSRTVPTVAQGRVVAMGPKCHTFCVDAQSGEFRWGIDLEREHGAAVPPWYAGQCPLVDGDSVILGVGGTDALLMSVGLEKGEVRWKTPNPKGWKMTHSSVVPIEVEGTRLYVYCAHAGVVGVAAKDGVLLWETPDWKISIATVPTPVPVGGGRVFLTGGYNAGSLMLNVRRAGEKFVAETEWRVGPEVFGATQQTPILRDGRLYGVRADGKFVCLSLDGKVLWASTATQTFGLGSYVMGGDLVYAVTDNGLLRLITATPEKYEALAQAQVLKGREAWGPMALVEGRLLVRDLTRLVCLDVAGR